jgi:hypothetical protein
MGRTIDKLPRSDALCRRKRRNCCEPHHTANPRLSIGRRRMPLRRCLNGSAGLFSAITGPGRLGNDDGGGDGFEISAEMHRMT